MCNLAVLLHTQGLNASEAELWYVRALRVSPNAPAALLNYAHLLNLGGHHAKALLLLQRLFQTHPPSLPTHRALAHTLRRANASEDAEKAYLEILEAVPSDLEGVEGAAVLAASFRADALGGRRYYLQAIEHLSSSDVAGGAGGQGQGGQGQGGQGQGGQGGGYIEWGARERAADMQASYAEYLWQWCGDVEGALGQLEAALALSRSNERARRALVEVMKSTNTDNVHILTRACLLALLVQKYIF
jgi:tetratricopeptide (TPR) repeat protein